MCVCSSHALHCLYPSHQSSNQAKRMRRKSVSTESNSFSDERDSIVIQQLSNIFDEVWPEETSISTAIGGGSFYSSYPWHSHKLVDNPVPSEEVVNSWRLKRKTNTVGVALVVCLNIGTDPPDVFKPTNCARKECWFDPFSVPKSKALEHIGNTLQRQYEKWQAKAKYKLCLDPTSEDMRRTCINLRKAAKSDRLLLHYNGHGVPKPTENGELWVFGKHLSHYMPVPVKDVRSWFGDPSVYVLDCSGAGALLPYFIDDTSVKNSPVSSPKNANKNFDFLSSSGSSKSINGGSTSNFASNFAGSSSSMRSNTSLSNLDAQGEGKCIVLAACKADETLPLNPLYPLDIFTSCLTTPIPTAIRWFILQNPYSFRDLSPDIFENIPGKDADRKTPRGELHWIFTAITDTIAWDTLPTPLFKKVFRQVFVCTTCMLMTEFNLVLFSVLYFTSLHFYVCRIFLCRFCFVIFC